MPRVVDLHPRSRADKDPLQGLLDFTDLDKTIETSGNRIRDALNKVRDDFIEWLREVTGIDLSGALAFTDWLFEEIRSRVGVDLENLAALLEDLGDLDLASLLDAVRGDYDGDNSVLLGIQSSIGTLRSLAAGIVAPWRIPQLTLSQLTAQPSPNLLTGFGDFADGSTLDGDGVWTWDGDVGKTTPGSARTTADGTPRVLTSEAIAVSAGQQLECSGWVRWQGASGSGACMQLLVVPYVGAAAQTPVVISNIVVPPGTVGVSSQSDLAGSYVVAANVTAVRVRLTAEAAMTAGTVWWDDVVLRKTATSLPQQWISGLVDGLGDLWDGVENVATIITQIADIFAGAVVTPINAAVGQVKDWFLGLLGWQDDAASATDAIAESVVSVRTQVTYVRSVISVRSGRPLHETGPDRTACVSVPFHTLNLSPGGMSISGGRHEHKVLGNTGNATAGGDVHNHSGGTGVNSLEARDVSGSLDSAHSHTLTMNTPVVNATTNYAPWASIIIDAAAERKVLGWAAYKSGTVTGFYLDVFAQEPDGSVGPVIYSSPNLAGELLTSLTWMQHLMDGASVVADIDDVVDVQFRMTGAGIVHIAGPNFPYFTPITGMRPYSCGSGRNPSTTPVPASLSTTQRDAMYVGPVPFVSLGIDVGQTSIPVVIADDLNRGSFGAEYKVFGNIQIDGGRAKHTATGFVSNSGAAMRVESLNSDDFEIGFDFWPGGQIAGVGGRCTSSLSAAVWLVGDNDGIYIQTGAYNSRTTRQTLASAGAGRYTLRPRRSDDDTHDIYEVFYGNPDTTDPIGAWPDTGGIVTGGIGRRRVAMVAHGAAFFPSSELDNFVARDIAAVAA
ncbi:minor tail protein [Gordonia phage DumpsterDude]|uniref:Minor tail protein n=1 Tax=Gordonia phage DumpsterDude TaxID=2713262 RepID=A0A6G8R080_9CAUD|nr:minor tail protein [Gordonia phage DumpsterDude]QIN93610.1 minor tail protein [Gordonia phage DumpsterDude]